MANSGLAGSRIRERRLALDMKQAHLAQSVSISPAYLNLIEHNRRRIGGKLLTDIAAVLEVEASTLAEGAEAALLASLRDAAAQTFETPIKTERIEDFAGRFPGWANLLVTQHRHIADLERTVEALSDRMAHDPQLAASLHDLLSTVTAINATSAILVETDQIESEWRDRFNRNIFEDSQRLAAGAQNLVGYLETVGQENKHESSTMQQLEQWLGARDFHIPELEHDAPKMRVNLLMEHAANLSPEAFGKAESYLLAYESDARVLPLAEFTKAATKFCFDPLPISEEFRADIATILRRLATLPTPDGSGQIGLVSCDGSGALTFRKPIDRFPMPRLGTACPLWPLYQALRQPQVPIKAVVEIAGKNPTKFLTYSIAQPVGTVRFDVPSALQATMLILPADRVTIPSNTAWQVGTNCRVCPKPDCHARREEAILSSAN